MLAAEPSIVVDALTAVEATPPAPQAAPSRSVADIVSFACLAAALVLWWLSLPRIDPAGLDDLGLASILPWTAWAALALIALGFALSLTPRRLGSGLPALHLAGLVLVLHATPAIAYGTLRYSWAWKHIGIVDFIQRHGGVDPVAANLPAYHNWPGFFVAVAFVADLLGLDPLQIADAARFTPTALNLLFLAILPPILRRFTDDPRLVWMGTFVFLAGNWVGQDYFSPQGVAFLLYLVVVTLCLGPLAARPAIMPAGTPKPLRGRLSSFASRNLPAPPSELPPLARAGLAMLALLVVLAIVATHQLTPIVLAIALAGLAAIGRLGLGYAIFTIFATALWLLHYAAPFVAIHLAEEFEDIGSALTHATGNLVDLGAVSAEQAWISLVCRGLTLGVAAAALAGGLRRLAAGHRDGPAVVLALAPLPLFAATGYGGEVIFRVYLFTLPFLALFAAAAFFPTEAHGRGPLARIAAGAFALALAVGFVFANNGKDQHYRFTPDEVEASAWLYGHAPAGALLIEGARNYPGQFMNYENFSYLPISEEDAESRAEILADPATVLGRWLSEPRWKAGYVLLTRSQKAYVEAQGVMQAGALDDVEEALLASPHFRLVHANRDAKIFALVPGVTIWRPDPGPAALR